MKNSMKVVIYDKNPGRGIDQKMLMLAWAFGCKLQKLFGLVDEYYGASSWADALTWLKSLETYKLESIQYWGHGSPASVWLAGVRMPNTFFMPIKYRLDENSLIWFRTCSTFQGRGGIEFSRHLADTLGCTIAGHTRIIGLLQSGLHTRKPNTPASWPETEKDLNSKFLPPWLIWGNNTIFCFNTKIPKGW
jgi:hypothetical protein